MSPPIAVIAFVPAAANSASLPLSGHCGQFLKLQDSNKTVTLKKDNAVRHNSSLNQPASPELFN
jgi:hypothetical protein